MIEKLIAIQQEMSEKARLLEIAASFSMKSKWGSNSAMIESAQRSLGMASFLRENAARLKKIINNIEKKGKK